MRNIGYIVIISNCKMMRSFKNVRKAVVTCWAKADTSYLEKHMGKIISNVCPEYNWSNLQSLWKWELTMMTVSTLICSLGLFSKLLAA